MADVKVKVGADTTQLTTGLRQASGSVDAFAGKTNVASGAVSKMKTAMTSVGVAGQQMMTSFRGFTGLLVASGVVAAIKSLFDEAGRINDLSQRFATSAESIQRIKIVADASGTSLETVAKAMSRGEISATKAADGSKQLQAAFEDLGISAEEFAGLAIEDRMVALADAYNNSSNKAETLAAMVQILGKNAGDLVPLFASGGEAIKQMMADATVATNDAVGQMEEVGDRVGQLFSELKFAGMNAIVAIVDGFQQVGIAIGGATAFWSKFFTEGKDAAIDARDEFVNAAIDGLEEQRRQRAERRNRVTSAGIAAIRAEAEQEGQAEADAKAAEEKAKALEKAADAAEREAKAAEKKAEAEAKSAQQKELDKLKGKEDTAKDTLDKAKGMEGNLVQSDALRRIGGGFAKSNYSGVSREAMLISKQVDYASKQLDELKKIVTELRKSDPLGGVTS